MIEQKTNIVILGAGYAGMLAALRLSAKAKSAQITLVNASDTFVERIRLHQKNKPQLRPIPGLLKGKNVRFVHAWVKSIDLKAREVTVQTRSEIEQIHYDQLVYALGSTVDRRSVAGVDDYCYTLTSNGKQSASDLHQILPTAAEHGQRLVVVGGGLTAIEAASEFAEQYPQLHVSILTAGTLGAHLSAKGRSHLRRVFARLGITIIEQIQVSYVSKNALVTASNESIPFDVCVWAAGFTVPTLARDAGLTVNNRGQILIDPYLRSISHPEIFAAGDSAAFVENPDAPIRMACATAEPMAAQAADNLVALINHQPQQPFGFQYIFQCISLGRQDGLIQWVKADDRAREHIFRGRLAAFIKEIVCRYAWWGVQIQGRLPQIFTWPGKKSVNMKVEITAKQAGQTG